MTGNSDVIPPDPVVTSTSMLVSAGREISTLPEPAPWFDARIVHTKDDTRVFRRPSAWVGDTEQKPQRFLADRDRFTEHKFSMKLPPFTARFVQISAELRDAHGLDVKLTVDGAPSDSGWVVTVPQPHRTSARIDARRFAADGTPVPGIGRDFAAVWIGVFNAQPKLIDVAAQKPGSLEELGRISTEHEVARSRFAEDYVSVCSAGPVVAYAYRDGLIRVDDIQAATHKYVHWVKFPEQDELYDLRTDSLERRNLAGDPAHAETRARLQQDLRQLVLQAIGLEESTARRPIRNGADSRP